MSDLTSNLEKLSGYLERFKSTGVSHHINGKNFGPKAVIRFNLFHQLMNPLFAMSPKGVPRKSHWQPMPPRTHFLNGVI